MSRGVRIAAFGFAIVGVLTILAGLVYAIIGLVEVDSYTCTTQEVNKHLQEFCKDSTGRRSKSDGLLLAMLGIGFGLTALALAQAGRRGGTDAAPQSSPQSAQPAFGGQSGTGSSFSASGQASQPGFGGPSPAGMPSPPGQGPASGQASVPPPGQPGWPQQHR